MVLERAHRIWTMSIVAGHKEKLAFAEELNAHGMFSIRQLAKIVRLSHGALSQHITKQSRGGRFNPESLTALVILRKLVLNGEKLPINMVSAVVKGGTSVSTLAYLVGANHTTLYVRLKENRHG